MYVPVLDSKIVGDVIADFRRKKGVSQEVLSGLANALDVKMSDIVREIENRID